MEKYVWNVFEKIWRLWGRIWANLRFWLDEFLETLLIKMIAQHSRTWVIIRKFGQTIWNKIEVLLGTSWWTTWKLGEPNGNMLKIREPPLPPPQEKNWAFHECMLNLLIGCMKLFFGWNQIVLLVRFHTFLGIRKSSMETLNISK